MPSGLQITVKSDTITPDLAALAKAHADTSELMRGIGAGLVGLAKRAFAESDLRPQTWDARSDGKPATLKDTSALWRSLRVVSSGHGTAVIGSDRPYAAIHQLGGSTKPHTIKPRQGRALAFMLRGVRVVRATVQHPGSKIPPRPFFPVRSDGGLTEAGERTVRSSVQEWLRARGAGAP